MIYQQARSRKSKDGKERSEGFIEQERARERIGGGVGGLPAVPTKIEEVPFRRQDRRTLNARYRRIMDRKLIVFILGAGLLLLFLGSTLVFLYSRFRIEKKYMEPFIVIGPVLIGGGDMTVFFSVEVCYRLYTANKRVLDPDLDKIVNPHEVKHWMDPQLIPYGWGLYKEEEEVITIEKEPSSPQNKQPPSSSTIPKNDGCSLPLLPTSMPSMSTMSNISTPILQSTTMESVMESSMSTLIDTPIVKSTTMESMMESNPSESKGDLAGTPGLVLRPSVLALA